MLWELSESEELSDPLEDDELEPEDELELEPDVEAEVLPLGRGLGGISEKMKVLLNVRQCHDE